MVYRPPPSRVNGFTVKDFFEEFTDAAHCLSLRNGQLLLLGALNLHLEDSACRDSATFGNILYDCSLALRSSKPSHLAGHCLDVIITRKDDNRIQSIATNNPGISDHFAINFNILHQKPQPVKKNFCFRKLKSVNRTKLAEDLSQVNQIESSLPVTDQYDRFESLISGVIEDHAPLMKRSVTVRPNREWYNSNIRRAKVLRRHLERKWKKSGLPSDLVLLKKQCNVNHLMSDAKYEFFSKKILDCKDDKKKLFNTCKYLLNYKGDPALPPKPSTSLPKDFNEFFIDKIVKIRGTINDQVKTTLMTEISEACPANATQLTNFKPATIEEVKKIICGSSSATCSLDPIPTSLLKEYCDTLVPVITQIVNSSVRDGTVPTKLKNAVVSPLLKKLSLDRDQFKNYRPVSNLSFVSKIIEKVVVMRTFDHLNSNNLTECMQSAYKSFHSTETALLRVQNDLLMAMHQGKMSALILLDLSAAFDTIDHGLLLNRMEKRFQICGSALAWFKSYLSDRAQSVQIENCRSDPIALNFGVPQGSVLGPILFSLYTSPLGDIVRQH